MKYKKYIAIPSLFVVLIAMACVLLTMNKNRNDYGAVYENPLIGCPLTVPVGILQYSDESYIIVDTLPDMKGKILIWIDSTHCAPCMIDYIYNYSEVQSYAIDSLGMNNAIYIMVNPKSKDVDFFKSELSNCSFPFTVYVDVDGLFNKANPFLVGSYDGLFAGMIPAYLLDEEGKIQTMWYSKETQSPDAVLNRGKTYLNMLRNDRSYNRIMP